MSIEDYAITARVPKDLYKAVAGPDSGQDDGTVPITRFKRYLKTNIETELFEATKRANEEKKKTTKEYVNH